MINLIKSGRLLAPLALLGLLLGTAIANAAEGARPITAEMRCPVCGMMPAHYPQWHTELIFKDNTMLAFDSPADMFVFIFDMAQYDKQHSSTDIANLYVIDHGTGGWLLASHAFFVSGSSVDGPMGPDLPAFASQKEAARFVAGKGGKVLKYEEVTRQVIAPLRHLSDGEQNSGGMKMNMNMDMHK